MKNLNKTTQKQQVFIDAEQHKTLIKLLTSAMDNIEDNKGDKVTIMDKQYLQDEIEDIEEFIQELDPKYSLHKRIMGLTPIREIDKLREAIRAIKKNWVIDEGGDQEDINEWIKSQL